MPPVIISSVFYAYCEEVCSISKQRFQW